MSLNHFLSDVLEVSSTSGVKLGAGIFGIAPYRCVFGFNGEKDDDGFGLSFDVKRCI
jgi:hypothetical protein